MKLFEYIFYRIAKYFYKRDGSDAIRALGIVSVIQGVLLADLLIIFLKLFVPGSVSEEYVKYGRIVGTAVALGLMFINYQYFKKKYWMLSDRWRESETSLQRKIRGWLVVFLIFAPFLILILLGTVFGRR